MPKLSFKGSRRKIIVTVVGVLLVVAAVGAGALLWWLQNREESNAPVVAEAQLPQAATDAQELAASGDVNASNKKINDALNKSGVSDNDKFDLYIQQGINFGEQNQHQQAFDSFKKAEAIKQNSMVSHLIAEQAEALGDKQTAISYYKKTISQLDAKSPVYGSDKKVYEDKIKELGGTL